MWSACICNDVCNGSTTTGYIDLPLYISIFSYHTTVELVSLLSNHLQTNPLHYVLTFTMYNRSMFQTTFLFMTVSLSCILGTPVPTTPRDDFIQQQLEEHLPIPDLARLVSEYEGGYHTTTAANVFHNGLELTGPKHDSEYRSDKVSIAPSTIIELGTLSQLTGEHYQDTSLELTFKVFLPQDYVITPSVYASIGVYMVHSTTRKTQGCVSYTGMALQAHEPKDELAVFVLLDAVIAPEEWTYELVLPPLPDATSVYQVQAIYSYKSHSLNEDTPKHVLFGQPKFRLLDDTSYVFEEEKQQVNMPPMVPYHVQDLTVKKTRIRQARGPSRVSISISFSSSDL